MINAHQAVFNEQLDEHLELFRNIHGLFAPLEKAAEKAVAAISNNRKLIFFGNGGSAADSQHISAELVGRFINDRPALPAMALSVDTSALTCISNDYSYDDIFSRQLLALGNKGDVAFGITTSGNSKNVIKGIEVAKSKGIITVGFLGKTGGVLADIVDIPIIVPSNTTARIQEVHIFLGHMLCSLIEKRMGYA